MVLHGPHATGEEGSNGRTWSYGPENKPHLWAEITHLPAVHPSKYFVWYKGQRGWITGGLVDALALATDFISKDHSTCPNTL